MGEKADVLFPTDGFYRVTCPEYTAGVTVKDGKITNPPDDQVRLGAADRP